MAEETAARDYQADAEAYLTQLTADLPAAEVALALALVANRAATRLHNVARTESANRKGTPEWPGWAALQNAARSLVLQSSTSRDLAAKLAGRRR
jgi:hypothetical protein